MVRILSWLRGLDLNQRPCGYEPHELTGLLYPASNTLFIITNLIRKIKPCLSYFTSLLRVTLIISCHDKKS